MNDREIFKFNGLDWACIASCRTRAALANGERESRIMADARSTQRKRSRIVVAVLSLWLIALAALPPILDYFPSIIFRLALMIVPGAMIGLFLMGILAALAGMTIWSLLAKQSRSALFYFAFILSGGLAVIAGRFAGGPVAVFLLGEKLQTAMAQPEPVERFILSKGELTATSATAFYITDHFGPVIDGLAYDSTGQLPALIELEPGERPETWQAKMPVGLCCPGKARRVWGNYYHVTMWSGR